MYQYIALLRGINVGGHRKVSMIDLKKTFESLGFSHVATYINSGNVIFSDATLDQEEIARKIEKGIARDFHFEIQVLIRNAKSILTLCESFPTDWENEKGKLPQVIFLGNEIDTVNILDTLDLPPEGDKVKYISGALLWNMDRETPTTSVVYKFISSTRIAKQVTIRTLGTIKKLGKMLQG